MPCAKRVVSNGVELPVVLGNVKAGTLANPDIPACSLTPISAQARTNASGDPDAVGGQGPVSSTVPPQEQREHGPFDCRGSPAVAERGIDFHCCADPAQAVTVAKDMKPTIILQNLVMPNIDGLVPRRTAAVVRAGDHGPIHAGVSAERCGE